MIKNVFLSSWFWSYVALVVCVILVFVLFYVMATSGSRICEQQTAQIGFEHRWDNVAGCMIEIEEDRWIPLSNYRYTDE